MSKIGNYSTSLATLTAFINAEIISQIIEKPQIESMPQKFLYTVLFKLNNGLNTCSLLFNNLANNSQYADSIFVILRTLISDSILYLYVLTKSEYDDNKLNEIIKALYFDHISFTMEAVKKNFGPIYGKSEEEILLIINEVKRAKPEYFDSTGNELISPLRANAYAALRYIASHRKGGESLTDIQRHYSHYDRFSKYEHIGDFSFELIHRQYDDKAVKEIGDEIVDAINLLTITMRSTLGAWPNLDVEVSDRFNQLLTRLHNSYSQEVK